MLSLQVFFCLMKCKRTYVYAAGYSGVQSSLVLNKVVHHHEVADPLVINTMSLRRAAQRIIPSLHRYSVTVKFLPLLYAKITFIFIYIYINIKSILGGGIGRFFTVTL